MYFENLMALWIAVEKEVPQETAFRYLEGYANGRVKKLNFIWTTKDIEDIENLKRQGLTYREIGELYCTTGQTIYKAVKRVKKKELPKQPIIKHPNIVYQKKVRLYS